MTDNEPMDSEGKRREASAVVAFTHLVLGLIILAAAVTPARAGPADDARIKQLRLLCVQLIGGDVSDPMGMILFKLKLKRCMSQDPATAIKQNAGLPTSGATNLLGKPVNPLPGGPVSLINGKSTLINGKSTLLTSGNPVSLTSGNPVSLTSGKPVALVSPGQALLVQETPQEIMSALQPQLARAGH